MPEAVSGQTGGPVSPYESSSVSSSAQSSVSEVCGWVRDRVRQVEFAIRGECMAPKMSGDRWNFDLASVSPKGVEYLPCVVWKDVAPGLDARLRRSGSSLEQAMSEGMVLTLEGTLWVNAEGTVGVRVTKIEPGFSRRGEIHGEDKRAMAALRSAGVHGSRLSKKFSHDNPKNAFRDIGVSPERVMVLGPSNAQGIGDLKRRLSHRAGSAPEVIYRTMSWTSGTDIGEFQAHLQEARRLNLDLVLLVQGGGHWSRLRGYQRADLALAIQKSPVPVATAVGHDANISVADRAAKLSFTTPTAAAEAIANDLDFHLWQRKKVARDAAAREQRQAERTARNAASVLLKDQIRILKKSCTEAWEAAEAAQRKQAETAGALHVAFRLHTQDLLETAEARVRLISRGASAAILVAVAALVLCGGEVLAHLQSSHDIVPHWLVTGAVVVTAVGLLLWQRRARRAVGLPSVSGMKHPPGDVDSWRLAVKSVRTIRKLRQLRHHMPR
jgi:exonuclease VII large subunit